MLFFMHVRYSKSLLWVFVGAGFFWLSIMLVLAMSDYMSRGWS
jgi:caa(3)-type oxidase subunit IV